MLNGFFSECFNTAQPPLSINQEEPLSYLEPSNFESIDDLLCTEDEVYEMIVSLDTSKANGSDGISARMLKGTAHSITPVLTRLFNMSIESGIFPDKWKLSSVVPIPKGGDHSNPSNYRPISLLSVISKMLERHVYYLITEHLSSVHPLANTQWGFQSGKSTVSALLTTTHDWFVKLEAGKEVCSVFFDLQKAFDSVPHRELVEKLSKLHISPVVLKWIRNYLTNRHQKVVIGGEESKAISVTSGVPQGSVLGPLLFLIYIDDVTRVPLSDGTKLVLYADDMLLYREIVCPEDYTVLQNDINTVNNWVKCNYLTFNASKCKYMVISHRRQGYCHPPDLLLDDLCLERVESFKYLGILLSSDLSWSKHIESICTKARKLLGLLYRRFNKHAEPPALFQLYLSLVRPHLEYASDVWDPHLLKDKTLIENVQKFGLRICAKQWDLSYNELLSNFAVPTLQSRRLEHKLSTMFKIVHNLIVYPPSIFVPRQSRTGSNAYLQPFARTNSFLHSFVPSTISLWNSLPSNVTSILTLPTFKTYIHAFNLFS